jgi:hypothetical protein
VELTRRDRSAEWEARVSTVRCTRCGQEIGAGAPACPACYNPLGAPGPAAGGAPPAWPGAAFEYRSARTLMGLPLVHIVYGPMWLTGFRPARGIVAVGNVALGVVALGGVAVGGIALGGLSLGLICLGGVALGLGVGLGGVATGYCALGGLAVGVYALGGLGIGPHTLQNDPALLNMLGIRPGGR